MKRIVNSPLKIAGLLTTILGLLGVLSFSYFSFVGIYLVGIGVLIYLVDYVTFRLFSVNKNYWTVQLILLASYLVILFITYMKWQEHNYIVFPNEFKGQAGIIFGIEGYPELPRTHFWKKSIIIPDDGLIITSTKVEEVPNFIRFAFSDNSKIDHNQIDWNPNFEKDCIINESKIKSWLFLIESQETSRIKNKMIEFCNEITGNKAKSSYKSHFSAIVTDRQGKYLSLQDRGLTSLPDGLGKLDIYRAILTGNSFTAIPIQLLEITSLEDLVFAANPISRFPCELSMLKRLKSISFADTEIKEIQCDLSSFDSLEHFDISRNDLVKFPEQIKTIPNLRWLSLDGNHFTDFSFVDGRLSKLTTLYLYSNKVKTISKETKYLGDLKELLIFDNEIDSIPNNISDLKSLEKLEIWDNPLKYISPNISKLTQLKSMRIDDDCLTPEDKHNLKMWLPNCEINYQTRSEKREF